MSVYFTNGFVNGLPTQNHGSGQGSSGSGGLSFPYYNPNPSDPNTQWCTGQSFNLSIPKNPDGSPNINAILQKLHDILYDGCYLDNMNFNSILDATGYFMQIASVWSSLSAADQQTVSQYLNMKVAGVPLIQIITTVGIPSIIYGTYFQSGSAAAMAMGQQLTAELNSLSANCPWLQPLATYANAIYGPNGATLQNWITQTQKNNPNETFSQFAFGQALIWQSLFSYNSDDANFFSSWRSQQISDVLNELGVKGNPSLELIILMLIMTNELGDSQATIAGQGNANGYLTNPMGSNAKAIASAINAAGSFTAQSAQALYNETINLAGFAKNAAVSSIATQINQFYQAMVNPNAATQITTGCFIVDGKTYYTTGQISLASIYANMASPKNPNGTAMMLPTDVNGTIVMQSRVPTWQDMANAMNGLAPSSAPVINNSNGNSNPSFPSQPGTATWQNFAQTNVNLITSTSNANAQIMQNDEGNFEKDYGAIQTIFQDMENFIKQCNTAMSQTMV